MRRLAMVGSLLLLTGLGSLGCSDNSNMVQAGYTATLTGTTVVPPVVTSSTGSTTMSFDGKSTMTYHVVLNAITGVTQVHIHSGSPGATGPVRVTLYNGPKTGDERGTLTDGSFGTADVQGESLDSLLGELRDGTAYVDVHTGDNPEGALRGQVSLMQ
jgi:hypothetical protein